MLKSLFSSIVLCSLLSNICFSQQVFFEDFTGSSTPSGWSVANNTGASVSWEFSTNPAAQGGFPQTFAYAGASTGHMRVDSDLSGTQGTQEDTDLFSPAINCSGLTNVNLRFWEYFRKFQLDTARVYVSTNGTSWTLVHTTGTGLAQNAGTDNPNEVIVDISSIAAGQSTVYLRWNYKGQWDYYWFIDDVEVYQPAAWDVECINIVNPTTVALNQAPFIISGDFFNWGSQTISLLTLNYTVNGGAVNTATVSNISWQPTTNYLLSHATHWNPPSVGTYVIEMWASNLNGNTDLVPGNDTATLTINVGNALAQRMVLLEDFVSSSGPPDLQANIDLHNTLNANPGIYTLLKYPMNWPGNGDPYFTTAGENRRFFYNVSAVPELFVDGGNSTHPSQLTGSTLTSAQAVPSYLQIDATHELCPDSQKISVTVDLTPFAPMSAGLTLQVAIIEQTTFNNTGGNGETMFYNIMKKMLPNEQGTILPALTNGVALQLEFDYYFQGNYRQPVNANSPINHATEHSVEEFEDLVAVVWVQNGTTMEVLNSVYSTGDTVCNDPVVAHAGVDQQICSGATVLIGGTPTASGGQAPYTYSWTPTTGLNDPTVENPVASPTVSTTYNVVVTDANGSTDTDNIHVAVLEATITIVGNACDTIITLTGTPGLAAYQWNTGETTPTIQVTQSGNYSYVGFHPSGCLLNSPIQAVTVGGITKPAISQVGNVISTQSYATYQWMLNGFAINGATQQNYTIQISGFYSVSVTNGIGCSDVSDLFFAELSAGCAVPTGTFTSNITTTNARFNWDVVPGAMSYLVRGKSSTGSNWVYLPVNNGTTNFKNVAGLSNGQSYDWQIRAACNASGTDTSAWSAIETFTASCQTPDTTWTDPVTSNGAQLHWTATSGTQGYEIKGRRIGGGWATILVGGASTDFKNVFGLLPSTTYEWTIRSLCNASGTINSDFTPLIQFTTTSGARLNNAEEFSSELVVTAVPNPFDKYTTLTFPNSDEKELSIWDVHGKLMKQWISRDREVIIEKSDLGEGVHILQVRTNAGITNLKLVVN